MTRLGRFALFVTVLPLLALALPSGNAAAEQKTVKEQLVGTWSYLSVDIVRPDGSRVPLFGPRPSGLARFNADGHYLLLTARSDIPRFASNNRAQGTAEENRAVVQGTIAHFGTYTVDEAEKTITFHIERSTFPNWNGAEQKRPFTVTANELKWTTAASSGGTAEVVLRRVQ
jgi:hypothetical protein